MNIHRHPKALSKQCLCGHVMVKHHCHLFLFQSGVEGIMALVTHLRRVMPCSITLNSAEWTWVSAYVCLLRGCVGVLVGKRVYLRSPPPPIHTGKNNVVTRNSDEMLHTQISSGAYYFSPLPARQLIQWDGPWFTHSTSCPALTHHHKHAHTYFIPAL